MAETLGSRKVTRLERSLVEVCRAEVKRGPAWLSERRAQAFAWLSSHGIPSSGDEAFRNTSLAAIAGEAVNTGATSERPSDLAELGRSATDRPVLWLVDGVAVTESRSVTRGVRVLSLTDVAGADESVRSRLGALAALENGFVAANTSAFADAWCILIDAEQQVEVPIEIRVVESGRAHGRISFPRVLVVAGAKSRCQLIERHFSRSGATVVSCPVVEIVIEPGAELEHARWVQHGAATWSLATTAVSVTEGASYRGWSATSRGRLVRHDLAVKLSGRSANVQLDGVYYGRQGEIVDQHVRVWHEQAAGQTRECYRGVIEDGGRGIFDGIIYVGRGALQTDARQENRNLLLGPTAIAHTKPHLEIDADDVSCSHGATVGQLDDEQLFYLRSRGIAESQARQVLTWSFAKEIVERCPNPQLRQEVELALEGGAQPGGPS